MIDDKKRQPAAKKTSPVQITAAYEGEDLGVTLGENLCVFKVWSPAAVQMQVLLYPPQTDGSSDEHSDQVKQQVMPMQSDEQGVWVLDLAGSGRVIVICSGPPLRMEPQLQPLILMQEQLP